MFLFDTDYIVFLQRNSSPEFGRIVSRMVSYTPADFYFPIISLHEEFLGWNSYINRGRTAAEISYGYSMLESVSRSFASWQGLRSTNSLPQNSIHFVRSVSASGQWICGLLPSRSREVTP
jgi:hypothetical protein